MPRFNSSRFSSNRFNSLKQVLPVVSATPMTSTVFAEQSEQSITPLKVVPEAPIVDLTPLREYLEGCFDSIYTRLSDLEESQKAVEERSPEKKESGDERDEHREVSSLKETLSGITQSLMLLKTEVGYLSRKLESHQKTVHEKLTTLQDESIPRRDLLPILDKIESVEKKGPGAIGAAPALPAPLVPPSPAPKKVKTRPRE